MQTYDVGISKSSAYRYLHKNYLSIEKTDMPRVVKFKSRKRYKAPGVPKAAKIGRTFTDFLAYTDEHEIHHWVEMDTVIGRVGGKVIMTFHFTQMNFMFGLLMDDKTSSEAAKKICALKKKLRLEDYRFGDLFPLLLTDNGGEFANVVAFTDDAEGLPGTRLYFCDPYCSSQKPRVEKNHTLFRDIVLKGESFDHFTQDIVNTIFSHINGSKRKSLNGKSPYEAFVYFYNEEVASILGIRHIPAEDVVQDKRLLTALKKSPPSNEQVDEPGLKS
jgi:IS30 family transposase